MATPVGHYLVGLAITQGLAGSDRDRKRGFVLAAVAVLPDIDVVAGLIAGDIWAFHRAGSHSLAAALAFGLVTLAAFALFKVRQPVHAAAMLFLVYASHLALDYMTQDSRSSPGVPLLWPWLGSPFQAPVTLVPSGAYHITELFSLSNAAVVIREAVIFLPLAALAIVLRPGGAPWLGSISWPKKTAWAFAGWFAVAVAASLAVG